jgi:ribosomal protein L16 Arg81 hydroxylase
MGEFAEQHWGRAPLLSRSAELPAPFDDLFSEDAVDELVSERALRTPFMRMARDGRTLPDRAFSRGAGTGAGVADQVSDDDVLRQVGDGATMVLQGLHRSWAPVAAFARELAADLGHPVQVNAYVTPPQSQGFADHYDVHDVFVLQVAGEKRWRVRPPVHPAPLRDEPWTDHREAVERAARAEPLIEATLRPGDCLYLPRGYLHAATALGQVSTHLTIGVHPWTRRHVADELLRAAVAAASEAAGVRASLPLGVDLHDPASWEDDLDLVRAALLQALQEVPAGRVADALAARHRDTSRAAPVRPLAQLRAAEALTASTVLALRPHLLARLHPTGPEGAELVSRAGTLSLAASDAAAVQALLDTGSATVAGLGEDLALRLVRGGVAVLP